jgi:hypothetical protein
MNLLQRFQEYVCTNGEHFQHLAVIWVSYDYDWLACRFADSAGSSRFGSLAGRKQNQSFPPMWLGNCSRLLHDRTVLSYWNFT